jgi:hypothetical protein
MADPDVQAQRRAEVEKQQRKSRAHFWLGHRFSGRVELPSDEGLFHRIGGRISDVPILSRKHTRNTDCTNNLAVNYNRDAALVRNSSLKPENSQSNSTPRDGIFKCFG